MTDWFIQCRTICKNSKVNWLKLEMWSKGLNLDHLFTPPPPLFARRPGTKYTGV